MMAVVHRHDFITVDQETPEADRCRICGMFRYEIMGPIYKHRVRRRQQTETVGWDDSRRDVGL